MLSENFFMRVARVGKYFVPPPLRARLRQEYSYFVRGVCDRRNKKERDHYLKNGTYLDWYAGQCDSDARANLTTYKKTPAKLEWMKAGVFQLNTAIAAGLKPHHSLLEFGCGFMRASNHFVNYLDVSNYSGNDASGERIAHGKKVAADVLGGTVFEDKKTHFYVNKNNTFDWLDGKKFDFIWSCSVLAHMPEADIEDLFDNIHKAMHEDSVFLFTYSAARIDKFRQWEHDSPEDRAKGVHELVKGRNHLFITRSLEAHEGEDCIEVDPVNWFHTIGFYEKIAEKRGLVVEDVTHFAPKADCTGFDYPSRLAKVTLRRTNA